MSGTASGAAKTSIFSEVLAVHCDWKPKVMFLYMFWVLNGFRSHFLTFSCHIGYG
jgi:hypothetical protein